MSRLRREMLNNFTEVVLLITVRGERYSRLEAMPGAR